MKEAHFERFTIEMKEEDALYVSQQGDMTENAREAVVEPYIREQLNKISEDDLVAELKECGAWGENDLKDGYENELRIIWIAGGSIRDEMGEN